MPRPLRIAFEGAIYHVTIRGNNGEATFRDDQDRRTYLNLLAQAIKRYRISVLAYVLMTNHIHLVVCTPEVNISAAMQWLHGRHAALFNRRHGHRGHLFGGRYSGTLVDRDEYLLESTRYVHLNPVRAGLVSHPREYPWSSYRQYAGDGDGVVPINCDRVLELLSPVLQQRVPRYAVFVEKGMAYRPEATDETVRRIELAAAAVMDALALPFTLLLQPARRNEVRAFVLATLNGVEGISPPAVAEYLGVTRRAVTGAAWRIRKRAARAPLLARRLELARAAAVTALRRGSTSS